MKAMLLGFVAVIVIAVGAHFALEQAGFSSREQLSSESVRLD